MKTLDFNFIRVACVNDLKTKRLNTSINEPLRSR